MEINESELIKDITTLKVQLASMKEKTLKIETRQDELTKQVTELKLKISSVLTPKKIIAFVLTAGAIVGVLWSSLEWVIKYFLRGG